MLDPVVKAILLGTLFRSVPLILACMGGFTSERGGIINIALEGKMMVAVTTGAFAASTTNNAYAGLAAGVGSSVLLSLLHWTITQVYRVEQIISGMAVNAIAFGVSSFLLDEKVFKRSTAGRVPTLPVEVFIALAIAVPLVLALYVRNSRGGLRLLAVGSDPDKARQMGVSPSHVRFWGLIATGLFCGLAGMMILTNEAGQASEGMTAGRGFIALAALIIGGWRPIHGMIACLAFGFFEALRVNSSFLERYLPQAVLIALPYLVTVIALAGFLGRNRTPAGLGKL